MKVKKNDTVVVITGKDVKKTGKVIASMPKLNKIIVEGVNVQEKAAPSPHLMPKRMEIRQMGSMDARVIAPSKGS